MERVAVILWVWVSLTQAIIGQDQIGTDIVGMEENEQRGYSVDISGDGRLLIASAPFRGESQGFIAVYAEVFNNWTFQWGINGIEGGNSGLSNAISSDGKVVAIPTPTTLRGQINMFEKVGIDYEPLGDVILGPASLGTRFGFDVALSGDGSRLAISAPRMDTGGQEDVGYLEILELADGEWKRLGSPVFGATALSEMGRSLALSEDGTVVAAGAPTTADNLGVGRVHLFNFNSSDWQEMGSPIVGGQDFTGTSVALSADGQRLIVGAPAGMGKASVYDFNGQDWQQVGSDIQITSSRLSGYSVDISGDGSRVIVSALGSNQSSLGGAVGVFDFDGQDWQPVFDLVEGEVGVAFGWSVALSTDGGVFAIGVPGGDGANENEGRVEVYQIDPLPTHVQALAHQAIEVFPNPAQDLVTIKGLDLNRHRPVQVVDMLGRVVKLFYMRTDQVNLGSLDAGSYFLLLPTGETAHLSTKLIITG